MLILIYMSKTENVIPRALKNVHLFNMTLALGGATSSNSSCRDKREKKLCVCGGRLGRTGKESYLERKASTCGGQECSVLWRTKIVDSLIP